MSAPQYLCVNTRPGSRESTSFRLLMIMAACLFALTGCQPPGLSPGERAGKARTASQPPCVVLALPASGPYAPIAGKIRQGAAIAQRELKGAGASLRIENINTADANWLAALDALPAQCAVVGGPLRDSVYSAARKAGALQRRVFFSFMPTLQSGDEGSLAWRFFPGPKDQIDALTNFVIDDLNIRSFGAFYPTDNYGRRMTALLEDNLSKRHITLHKASYNPSAPATWGDALEPLIQPTVAEGSGTPIPQTPFEAIFLPDSWKKMDMLTTSMMYNGEDRLVLMGTTLWESGLAGKPEPKAAKYSIAVFPGAWDQNRAPSALRGGGNDFWTALGYDFVNFALAMGMDTRPGSPEVAAAARKAARAVRAMAPVNWNSNGVASQDLYLFQVGSGGMKALDIEEFSRARANVLEQAALRMQGLPGGLEERTPPPRALPQGQIMSPVPQPSYKLRLPGRP